MRELRRGRVANGAEDAEPGSDSHRAVHDRIDDKIRGLFGRKRGNALVDLVGAIIGVRTSGMLIVVKWIPLSRNSEAAHAENESSAAFDATYAENRGAFVSTPIDEILMMWPRFLSIIFGRKPRMSLSAPK